MICQTCASTIEDLPYCPHCGVPTGKPETSDYQYEAFISYRHLPRDTAVAKRMQRAIEGKRVPKGMRAADGGRRLGRMFRDEDELPISGSLPDQITEALAQSRRLIVVCSPHTNESKWVQREVELYASLHGRDRILVALAEGEAEESFPALLLHRKMADASGVVRDVAAEPLAADLRSDDRRRFSNECVRIEAALLHCSYDDLRQRLRTRRVKLVAAISSVIAAVSVAFGTFSLYQQHQIQRNYEQVLTKESELLARDSQEELASGNRIEALRVALQALPDNERSSVPERPFVPAACYSLTEALQIYPSSNSWGARYVIDQTTSTAAYSDDGLQAVQSLSGKINVYDVATGEHLCEIRPKETMLGQDGEDVSVVSFKFCSGGLLYVYPHGVGLYNARTGVLLWDAHVDDLLQVCDPVEIGARRQIAVVSSPVEPRLSEEGLGAWLVVLIDLDTGATADTIRLPVYLGVTSAGMAASNDGTLLAFAAGKKLTQLNLGNGEYLTATLEEADILQVIYLGELLCVVRRNGGDAYGYGIQKIEGFDQSLKSLWTYQKDLPVLYDGSSDLSVARTRVVGAWFGTGATNGQVLAYAGTSIVLIDPSTGEVTYERQGSQPFVDVSMPDPNDTDALVLACSTDGEVIEVIPDLSDRPEDASGKFTAQAIASNYASFVTCEDSVYLALWARVPSRYSVYRMNIDAGLEHAGTVEAIQSDDALYINDEHVVVAGTDSLVFLNSSTYESECETPLDQLQSIDIQYSKIICAHEACYVIGSKVDDTGGVQAYALSYENGEVLDDFEVDCGSDGFDPNANASDLVVCDELDGNKLLFLIDAETCSVYDMSAHKLEAHWRLADETKWLWCAGETVLAMRHDSDGQHHLVVLDAMTGDEITSALSTYAVIGDKTTTVALDRVHGRVTVACADGATRCFSTGKGDMVWESMKVPPNVQFLCYASADCILAQDPLGRISLYDGVTGEQTGSSSTQMPIFSRIDHTVDADVLYGTYETPHAWGTGGIVTISIDERAFGPVDNIYTGIHLSADASRVLVDNPWNGRFMSYQRYELDEMMAQANSVIDEYEEESQ